MDAGADAAPVGDGADGDDVDVEGGAVAGGAPVGCALEGLEIGLGEPEDVLWLCELDDGGEEHGEGAVEAGGGAVVGIGGEEAAGEEAVDERLELVGVEAVWGGGEEGEGEDKVAEEEDEEGEVAVGGWGCLAEGGPEVGECGGRAEGGELIAELEGDEGLLEVVGAEGVEHKRGVLRYLLAVGRIDLVTLVCPPARLVEQLLQLAGDLLHPHPTLLHPPPRPRNAPALRARLGRLVERVQLQFAPVVQHDDHVHEPVEPRLPRRDPPLRVRRCVRDEVRRREPDRPPQHRLVDRAGIPCHPREHVEHKLCIVCRVILSVCGCECVCARDGRACLHVYLDRREYSTVYEKGRRVHADEVEVDGEDWRILTCL